MKFKCYIENKLNRMKKIGLIFLMLTFTKFSFSQTGKVAEVNDKNLKSTLCAIDTAIFKSNMALSVAFFKVSNPSGSAHLAESDEVTNRFLIAVSALGEDTEEHLYNVGNFYNPQILKFDQLKNNNYRVMFEYGPFKQRKKMFLNISLKAVTLTDG